MRRTLQHQLEDAQQRLQTVTAVVEQIPEQDDAIGPVVVAL